jgi:hypothetical protein
VGHCQRLEINLVTMSKDQANDDSSNQEHRMDLYIRMNEDYEKDYCFNVDAEAPISSLRKIFDVLPMVLSPSYFYKPEPIGFAVSTYPGFLTSEGGLLFSDNAHKSQFLRTVDQNALIKDVVWEGQLVVPIWDYDYSRSLTVGSLLLLWLYMDLPEFISPTPGTAPMGLLFRAIEHYFPALKDDTPSQFDSHAWQWGFFAFHLVKVLFIYLVFQVGGVNPRTFNVIAARLKPKKALNRDDLLSIGWTGARRATPEEWRDENRKFKIEQAGGIVKAYHEGILEGLASQGVQLGKGEGFDSYTPASDVNEAEANKTRLEGKFVVSKAYFREVYQGVANKLMDEAVSAEEKSSVIKTFRRAGPRFGTEKLQEWYAGRKKVEPTDSKK